MKRKIKKYEKIILSVLEAELTEMQDTDVKEMLIADKTNHHYMLLKTGWYDTYRFIDNMLIHFEIKEDGKIWLLSNHTENPITEELVKKGIPPSDIVLGFHTKTIRAASGYAIM